METMPTPGPTETETNAIADIPNTPELTAVSQPEVTEDVRKFETAHRAHAHLSVAYHGLREHVAYRRVSRAAKSMDRHEHKSAMHHNVGEKGKMHLPSASSESRYVTSPRTAPKETTPNRPRTFLERHLDKRMAKKLHKQSVANVYARRVQMIYGPRENLNSSTKLGKLGQKYNLWKNYRGGNMSAQEHEIRKLAIESQYALGKNSHKKYGETSSYYRKHHGKLHRSVRIRNALRDHHERKAVNAEARMFRNRRAAERHSVQQAKIRDERLAS